MADLSGMLTGLNQAVVGAGQMALGAPINKPLEQQTAMERAGVTNPLLQSLGMGLGGMLGTDMRSQAEVQAAQAAQQQAAMGELLNAAMQEKDPAKLRALAGQVSAADPATAFKLVEMAKEMEKGADPYANLVVVGNNIYDKETRTFQTPPEGLKKDDIKPVSVKDVAGMVKDGVVTKESAQKYLKSRNEEDLVFTVDTTGLGEEYNAAKAGADNMITQAKELLELAADSPLEASWQTITSFIPGSEGMSRDDYVKTLQSNLAFDRLQAMRDASKTGGALGQVSNIELELLKASLTALNPNSANFKKQIQRVIDHYSRFTDALEGKSNAAKGYETIEGQSYKVIEKEGKTYYFDGKDYYEKG